MTPLEYVAEQHAQHAERIRANMAAGLSLAEAMAEVAMAEAIEARRTVVQVTARTMHLSDAMGRVVADLSAAADKIRERT